MIVFLFPVLYSTNQRIAAERCTCHASRQPASYSHLPQVQLACSRRLRFGPHLLNDLVRGEADRRIMLDALASRYLDVSAPHLHVVAAGIASSHALATASDRP